MNSAVSADQFIKVTCNSKDYYVKGDGVSTSLSVRVDLPSLSVGDHADYIVATNKDGDQSKVKVKVALTNVQNDANEFWQGYTVKTTTDVRDFKETGKAVELKVDEVYDLANELVSTGNYVVKHYESTSTMNTWITNYLGDYSSNKHNLTNWFADADNLVKGTGEAPSKAAEGFTTGHAGQGDFVMAIFPANGEMADVTIPKMVQFSIYSTGMAEETFEIVQGTDAEDKTFVYSGNTNLLGTADGTTGIFNGASLLVDGQLTAIYDSESNAKKASSGNKTAYYVSKVDYVAGSTVNTAGAHVLEISKSVNGGSGVAVANVTMNVEKFDLSKATVVAKDQTVAAASSAFNVTLSYDGAELDLTFANTDQASNGNEGLKVSIDSYDAAIGSGSLAGYKGFFGHAGLYGFTISAAVDATLDTNLTFSGDDAKGEVRIITDDSNLYEYFGYGETTNADTDGTASNPYVIDKTTDEFEFEKIGWGKVANLTSGEVRYDVDDPNATITITDEEGNVVSDPSTAGTYLVTVQLPTGVKYEEGGSGSFYVKVVNGTAANVYFTVDGKPVTSTASVDYDGEAVPFTALVKLGDKAGTVLKEGTDYTVEILKDGVKVSEIKDYGTYEIVVKGKGYEMPSNNKVTVTVNASKFDGVVAYAPTYGYDTDEYKVAVDEATKLPLVKQDEGFAYTGKAVTPEFKLYALDSKGEPVYFSLPADSYVVTYRLDGKAIAASDVVKVDDYTADLIIDWESLEDVYGEGAGFKSGIVSTGLAFSIVDTIAGGFSDVKASEWYADEATKAKQLGYMTGLSGTSMLLPDADITRADVAMVLMRMAGGDTDLDGEKFPTKFADVAEDAYYAKAVDWAYKAGIITGYDGSSNFGPNDLVTREQLATMIARFAEKVQGEDVSAGEIDGYVDADSVQGYAKPGMAYCVEAGIFGVNTDTLDPQGNASRAQVAAISVRVAPAQEL